ncbi:MAG TPA: hypothetical protein PKD51_10240 [Saprospiraceae bacterium]|nr:hypothetical protein [Saprospiraceae bacterium]HMU06231.1 hypothetical protein [Saprospiraceae bacterium]
MQVVYRLLFFSVLIFFFSNCNKTIYVNSDHAGYSQYTLYGKNFKYKEKTTLGEFSNWGTYLIKDSVIYFDFKDIKKIPYNYISNHIQKLTKRRKIECQRLDLKCKLSEQPIIFASIWLKDSLDNIIEKTESDIDGNVLIFNNEKATYVEIYQAGYSKHRFNYVECFDFDLEIKLEELKPGGRMVERGLLQYIDFVLEYQVDNPTDFLNFERSGIVFRRKK